MYKRFLAIVALGLLATCVGAAFPQSPKPAPTVSDALKAQYFKAQSQMVQAKAQEQIAQQAFQQAVSSISAACGANFQPQMNEQGDPVCAPKTEEKPAAKK